MKKIGKLLINPEKVIKNEELVNLKGGNYSVCVCCTEDGTGNCISEWFQAQFDNCDDGLDWAYFQCGNHNNACNSSITCSPII